MSFLETLQNKNGKKWLIFYLIFALNFLLIDIILLLLNESWGDLNLIVSGYLGTWVNIVLIVFLVLLIPFLYGSILFLIYLKKIHRKNEIRPHILHKILPGLLILLFDTAFLLLIIFYEQYSKVILQIFEYYSIILIPIIGFLLIFLLKPIIKIAPKLRNYISNKPVNAGLKVKTILICITVLYGFIFISPFLFIPANVVQGRLPNKPNIFGHRGACHIAPENTLPAIELAAENGALGIEIDIRYTSDGELILLHDDTLTRTTDVAEKFPDRKNDDVDTFTLSEIRSLDAGSWFVDYDPWGVISSRIITSTQAEQYRGIEIPSFLNAINLSRDLGLIVDLDTKFSSNFYFEKMINQTKQSGIPLKNIIVATDKADWIEIMKNQSATEIQLGINMRENPSLERFQAYEENYTVVKAGDDFSNALYSQFAQAGIPVLVYIIDSPERFLALWCLGTSWVMSNEVHTFNNIGSPLYIEFSLYMWLWTGIYISAISIFILLLIKKKRENS